jgi:integrase/recombinase XerD
MAGASIMNAPRLWTERIEDYLAYRRNAGFNVVGDAPRLRQFGRFADQQTPPQSHLVVELAVAWAQSTKRSQYFTWARRLELLRGFARYWQRFDPVTEVPPGRLIGRAYRRLTPHIFTQQEVSMLMAATTGLQPRDGLRPATCKTMIGLLAASGLRPIEATRLTRNDVDLDQGLLLVQEAKGHRSRLIPLHPSATEALRTYAQQRDRLVRQPGNDRFFLLDKGKPAGVPTLQCALETLCRRLRWLPRGDYAHHRCYDFRHSFVANSLLRSDRHGIDADHAILALSTYLGHASVAHTYWYCTAVPELMAIVGERFHQYAQGEST